MKKFSNLGFYNVEDALARGAYSSVHGSEVQLTDPDGRVRSYSFPENDRESVIGWVSAFNTRQLFPAGYNAVTGEQELFRS